jgi:TonB family protein
MAARNKPYDQFGPYILFKKLESDALGDSWRAGRISGTQIGPVVALRRITGGDRDAMVANAEAVAQVLPRITGTSFARDQQAGVQDGVPFLSWDYAGGRSLRHIIDRARGGKDVQPNPLPTDQAIVIAEKVALSLATMADLRDSAGTRLSHGALIPQFIWISDDGEIRVGGQQMGQGLMASLQDQKVAAEFGRYFSPEYRSTGQMQKNMDVYSMGAIVFLLVTGQEPPDAATASAFAAATRAARTMTGAPIPDDIRVILDKSFNLDPSMRYASIGDMKQAISALANGGKYSATTFNLAFYLSNLLKKEMEGEAIDRDKESKVNVAPYLEAPKPAAAAAATAPAAAAAPAASFSFGVGEEKAAAPKKSKLPLAIAATVVLIAGGAGAFMMLGKSNSSAAPKVATAQTIPAAAKPAPPPQRIISEPIAVTPEGTTTAATTTTGTAAATDTGAAQQKAFEDAVRARMQAEMLKLQEDFNADLSRKQAKNAPVASTPPAAEPVAAPAPAEDRAALTAAQLDQQRRETQVADSRPAVPAPVQTQTTAPQQPAVTASSAPAPAVAAPVRVVREGDVIAVNDLDVVPRITRAAKPVYPPIALRQKINATVMLTVLVSETGEVLDVRVLRGDPRFGINDAAIRAMRSTRFSPGIKDGKRVRTWFPQSIEFKAS